MDKAQRTRQLIVEKTAPLFNTKGYAGTSLADMTDATGLTKGSVYGNFANKEAVALAAFEYNWQQAQATVRAIMAREQSNKARLLALAATYRDLPPGFPEGGCPLLNTAIEADDTHPALRDRAMAAFAGWKQHLVTVIEAGIAAGEFRQEVDAEQTAVTLIALIEGTIMISRLTGQRSYSSGVMQTLENIVHDLS